MQDPKYEFVAGAVKNRHDGKMIPRDEPVFVFRARDAHAARALIDYAASCEDPRHQGAVLGRVADFLEFARAHPERMKEPDTAANPVPGREQK